MTIIRKKDNPNISMVLDNIMEIKKGDCIRTCADTYYGWHTINFKFIAGYLEQWDYGKSDDGKQLRDEQYEEIVNSKV